MSVFNLLTFNYGEGAAAVLTRAVNDSSVFTITEKAPTTSGLHLVERTFKTLCLTDVTPRQLDVKLECPRNYH